MLHTPYSLSDWELKEEFDIDGKGIMLPLCVRTVREISVVVVASSRHYFDIGQLFLERFLVTSCYEARSGVMANVPACALRGQTCSSGPRLKDSRER